MGQSVLTNASCERADKVESEDLFEIKHHPRYRQYFNFSNRLPNGKDFFKGIGNESREII
jgi:hypothetical protein